MLYLIQVLLGLGLLYGGGEVLVRSARSLARRAGLSPLVVGLTVVAFGTSSPELAASLAAALQGSPEIAFGNVVGSNVANLGLVLGIAGLIRPLRSTGRFLRREVPFMVGSSAVMLIFAWNGLLGRGEGLVLLALLGVYLAYLLRIGAESPEVEAQFRGEYGGRSLGGILGNLAGVLAGALLLALGAKALITGATTVARLFGVGDRLIGLTLVALGTSLPELASTVVAALRREGAILLGNLVGSNVFNVLFILGLTPVVRPLAVEAASAELDLAVMLGLSLLAWPLMASRKRLERWEGAVLVVLYGAYIGWLFVRG